jgi:hypothetical protein
LKAAFFYASRGIAKAQFEQGAAKLGESEGAEFVQQSNGR